VPWGANVGQWVDVLFRRFLAGAVHAVLIDFIP
jgi:hypothetical protein